jgi:putative molybdopterin biosynthesis protein
MSIYLHDISLPQARARFDEALVQAGLVGVLGTENLPLDEHLLGRVLAQPVWARSSSPHYHASAMDGFALRASDIAFARPTAPVNLSHGTQAQYLDTGDPLPTWADTVIPIELVESLDTNTQPASNPRNPAYVRVRAALPPWSHIRPLGEDIVASQLVLPSGHTLRPVDLGALAASGASQVSVNRKPQVAVIPSGSELVPAGQPAQSGQIIEFNSIVMAAQLAQWGAEPKRYPITPDNPELLRAAVLSAIEESDLILLNAGSSAGAEDFSARIIAQLGEVLVHGIAVRPGHPVIIGMIRHPHDPGRSIPILGVPGYPVSAALTMEILVEPLIAQWLGRASYQPQEIIATLTRKLTSPAGDDDYVRVVVGQVGEKLLAAPLTRGAGVITSLVRADGISIIPRGIQGLEAGASITVRLNQPPQVLRQTIFAIGSHDLTLDVLAQFLNQRNRRLVSANVGSQGGLVAVSRGEAHLAGTHLLDPSTGEYNLAAVQRYLEQIPVRLMVWAEREQGLMLARGNPRQVRSLEDLTKPGITMINRQRGSGTRVLLDYHLNKLGVDPKTLNGYQQEEYTHLAVAAAVASGRADCGLGITAAAHALDLDFIPLFYERYDLVIPQPFFDSVLLAPFFDLTQDLTFKRALAVLPGYNLNRMGEIIY